MFRMVQIMMVHATMMVHLPPLTVPEVDLWGTITRYNHLRMESTARNSHILSCELCLEGPISSFSRSGELGRRGVYLKGRKCRT